MPQMWCSVRMRCRECDWRRYQIAYDVDTLDELNHVLNDEVDAHEDKPGHRSGIVLSFYIHSPGQFVRLVPGVYLRGRSRFEIITSDTSSQIDWDPRSANKVLAYSSRSRRVASP